MLRYVIQRLVYGFITLFLVVSFTFLLLQFMPGSPFNDEKLTKDQLQILNEKYGLNDPKPIQYARYMKNVFTGDFGVSFQYNNQSVSSMIGSRLHVTVQVGLQALFFGAIVGIILGAFAALKKNSIIDHLTVLIAIIGVSVPSFVLATLMQYYFGVKYALFPVVYNETLISTWMPTFALSLFVISSSARFMRTELVEVLSSDYILLARAKGMSKTGIIYRHALRNALIPVITVLGPMTISLLTGSTVIEKIFGIPGVSFLLIEGIQRNDYFVILGVATFYSVLYIGVIIIIDILYGFIDPRIRLSGGASS